MSNNITPQLLMPHGMRAYTNTGFPSGILTHDTGSGYGAYPIEVMLVDPSGNYVDAAGGGGSTPTATYSQVAASHATGTVVIKAAACIFYGIENLSVNDLSAVTIAIYDNATTGSGNLLGQFNLGPSQSVLKPIGVNALNGITIVISSGTLNSDGGLNVLHS